MGRDAPHRQVWFLAVVSAVALGLVVSVAVVDTASVDDSLSRSRTDYLPASAYLVKAGGLNRASGEATIKLATSLKGRATRPPSSGGGPQKFNAVWANYKRLSANLPGEAALDKDFLKHQSSYQKIAFQHLSAGTAASAPALAALRESLARQQSDLDALQQLYLNAIATATTAAHHEASATKRDVLLFAASVGFVLLVAFALVFRRTRLRELEALRQETERKSESRRTDLETRLQRAFEMVKSEEPAYALIEEAMGEVASGAYAELLVADSSRAHFRQVATTDHETPSAGCAVTSPTDCPATSRGQTRTFISSSRIDACPHLRGRPTGECSALCVPVSIAGKTVGVVHATGRDGELPDPERIATLELVARKTGEHVGMIRAFARSETQAQTDALTGLLNRRSLEQQSRELIDNDESYIVVYGDLDHFKQLNDVYGHDAGDRALRLFARVLRDSVRPNDLLARYGGEEFVVVLPECALPESITVIERIQARLADALQGGTVPPFTGSFGLAESKSAATFSETLERADAALLRAKAEGRNRWVIAGNDDPATTIAAPGGTPFDAPTGLSLPSDTR